jgi:hypothetical protein
MASTAPPGFTTKLKEPITIGDDYTLRRTFPDVPEGQAVQQATWTVKEHLTDTDASAVWQKTITTGEVVDVGMVEDNGATTGKAVMRWDVTETETLSLLPGVTYLYDVQVVSTAGRKKTIEKGNIVAEAQVTLS